MTCARASIYPRMEILSLYEEQVQAVLQALTQPDEILYAASVASADTTNPYAIATLPTKERADTKPTTLSSTAITVLNQGLLEEPRSATDLPHVFTVKDLMSSTNVLKQLMNRRKNYTASI